MKPLGHSHADDRADLVALERRICDPRTLPDWGAQRTAVLRALYRTSALDRCLVISAWALSNRARLRRLSAVLVAHAPHMVGAPSVLRRLADDPDPSVRRQVARAASAMSSRSPLLCRRVLHRLQRDNDPEVRAVAGRVV